MKRNYNLECEFCGKTIYQGKKVCLLKIADQEMTEEYGVELLKFCKKQCASEWLERNKSFEFVDEDFIENE